jgi:hypothetical protein
MSRIKRRFILPPGLRPIPEKNGELTSRMLPIDSKIGGSLQILEAGGWITCTRGRIGEAGATYALGWIELDEPERYTREVRERHARNMLRWTIPRGTA